jgi:hypothetical protein
MTANESKISVGFAVSDEPAPDDEEFEQQGLRIFVEDRARLPLGFYSPKGKEVFRREIFSLLIRSDTRVGPDVPDFFRRGSGPGGNRGFEQSGVLRRFWRLAPTQLSMQS